MFKALLYAYVLGGLTFIPLLIVAFIFVALYTSVPVGDADVAKQTRGQLESSTVENEKEPEAKVEKGESQTNDVPRTRKGWLTMRRTFEETAGDGSYVTLVRSFLDSRSKDPKRSRPKDMWYVVLKGNILYLYEDESMSECEAAVELSSHQVVIYPEGLLDAELFAKRNAICLKPKKSLGEGLPSVSKQMNLQDEKAEDQHDKAKGVQREALNELEKNKEEARKQASDPSTPWFIFVRSNVEMEDWYFALIHASEQPSQTPTLAPLSAVYDPMDMDYLLATLDEQPDVIPMRWLNALLGRIFFSHYRTHNLEAYIIGRLMKKLSKVKRPAFLTEIAVTQVSVGNKAPMLSKPMLKELTKEGDASIEVHLHYKGEVRITVEATAVINLGARFKSYTVKLALAAVLKELEGNLLVKVKRPPSNRIWYAFTQNPRMVLEVEPIVSDRQITWGMILSTIESKFKEIIQESVVMPNMDDIAFFETSAFEHRGGIWSDASRKPYMSKTVPSTTEDDAQSIPTITKTSEDDVTDSSRNNTKRRSWFTSIRDEDQTLLPEPGTGNNLEESRGRTLEVDSQSSSPRSQSTPKPSSMRSSTSDASDNNGPGASVEQQSRHRSSSSVGSTQFSENELSREGRAKSTPTTPRKNSDASEIARSASPPSFFSTLKSKAADKQAISNTAKEAMRKWGVNWGGFKKEASNSSSGDETPQQAASSPPRSTLSENANLFAQKARASYAEVRAAVAERKERDRNHEDSSAASSSSSLFSAPRQRVLSNPMSNLPNGSVYSDAPSNPSIITSAARLNTPRLTSEKSTPSLSRVSTEVDAKDLPEVQEPVKQAPIHVQPQAKTMSIPGIHASHRGELQSMGYVAPQPSAPPATAETMLKNPAIQTVYRLWKNPSSQGGTPHDMTGPSESLRTEEAAVPNPGSDGTTNGEDNASVLSAAALATPAIVANATTAPPLPPRSPPAQQVLTK
ncbi:hypothetical protein CPC08DRAFT_669947, partial [Agrocybe pediades]